MLYATNTGIAALVAMGADAVWTSAWTLVFQLPIHLADGALASLSICAASAGRVVRHASAVLRALDEGSTHSVDPMRLRRELAPESVCVGGGAAATESPP